MLVDVGVDRNLVFVAAAETDSKEKDVKVVLGEERLEDKGGCGFLIGRPI